MKFRELSRIFKIKPEPQTTPSLAQVVEKEHALNTVQDYFFTSSLKEQFKRIFDCENAQKNPV